MNKLVPLAVGGLVGATLVVVKVGKDRTRLCADTEGDTTPKPKQNQEPSYSPFKTCPKCKGNKGWYDGHMGFSDWEECGECSGLGYVPKFISK